MVSSRIYSPGVTLRERQRREVQLPGIPDPRDLVSSRLDPIPLN